MVRRPTPMRSNTMTRLTLIRVSILLDIADDYETFSHITSAVAGLGSQCGIDVAEGEVSRTIIDLIRSGLVRAYQLSPVSPAKPIALSELPEFDDESLYFYITEKGKTEIHRLRAEPDWPFDDFLHVRPGYSFDF
jgi:hypothetical protein